MSTHTKYVRVSINFYNTFDLKCTQIIRHRRHTRDIPVNHNIPTNPFNSRTFNQTETLTQFHFIDRQFSPMKAFKHLFHMRLSFGMAQITEHISVENKSIEGK